MPILQIPIFFIWIINTYSLVKGEDHAVHECIRCTELEVGSTFIYDGNIITVADDEIIEAAISSGDDLRLLCTSHLTDMSYLFSENSDFNQDISCWDVSNVTDMEGMFYLASSFNHSLNSWDVSKVENMERMFAKATSFVGNISDWDVDNVYTTVCLTVIYPIGEHLLYSICQQCLVVQKHITSQCQIGM